MHLLLSRMIRMFMVFLLMRLEEFPHAT